MSEPTVPLFCDEAVELARLVDVLLEYAARDDLIGDLADIAYGAHDQDHRGWIWGTWTSSRCSATTRSPAASSRPSPAASAAPASRTRRPPWSPSTSPPPRNCRPPRSATWRRCAGSPPASV